MDPFVIQDKTLICFSGGRTSAYLLWRVIQSNNGLPDDAVVLFANTGKEEEATLRFVDRCSREWNVPITWLEYEWKEDAKNRYRVVTFETASRNGEPFEAAIRSRRYLPNPVARYCTSLLKIRPFSQYLASQNEEWIQMVGIRADEQRRVAKIRSRPKEDGFERVMPLAEAGVTKKDVGEFWANNSFDLELPNMNGVTMHGNCDLCYLKGASQILSLIQEKPERAIWWAKMENMVTEMVDKESGAFFRSDRPSYTEMARFQKSQASLFEDETIPCFCGD